MQLVIVLEKLVCNRLCVADDLRRVLLERRVGGLLKGDSDAGDGLWGGGM